MKLVSSWSHYLDFECNDCGETTHVDAARLSPDTVKCRSSKCRTASKKIGTVVVCSRSGQIGVPVG